jgi:4-hydroxybenzoate polyprenyltransferase
MTFFYDFYRLLRITHWSKGIFVLLGVVYADSTSYWPSALLAAFSFCLVASAVYIYNDIQDLAEDRVHPHKKNRPLASNQVSVRFAVSSLIFLLLGGLGLGFFISIKLALILSIYLLINLIYNHWLRLVPIFDVLCIASGFMLRIFAGTWGIGLPITMWLTLTATLLSLLIALAKRRLEMNLGFKLTKRAVLKKYRPKTLDLMIILTGYACFTSYFLYTIYPRDRLYYFMLTLPFTAFGLWRFTHLTFQPAKNDDPILLLFSDKLSLLNLLCFCGLTLSALFQ